MGRQIQFYMLPEDRDRFFRFVQESDPVVVTLRDADSAEIQPLANFAVGDRHTLSLWNRRILSCLKRKWIPDPQYYRVDELRMPTLEFDSSFKAKWEAKPALGRGRLFGIFDPYLGKPPEFEKWYESLVRWIRKNFRRNPTGLGGYVGPAAYDFYKSGGFLLPNFLPPRTKEWLAVIGKQHARRRQTR